jgi:hypothetical protein
LIDVIVNSTLIDAEKVPRYGTGVVPPELPLLPPPELPLPLLPPEPLLLLAPELLPLPPPELAPVSPPDPVAESLLPPSPAVVFGPFDDEHATALATDGAPRSNATPRSLMRFSTIARPRGSGDEG